MRKHALVFVLILALCRTEASSSSPSGALNQAAALSSEHPQPQTESLSSNASIADPNAAAVVDNITSAISPSLTLPTSIGESSLVDRESGRIFWQGGPSVLFLSSGSVLERAGIKHVRATALSGVLLLAALSALAAWTRDKLVPPSPLEAPVIDPTGGRWRSALVFLARCTVLLPRFSTWFVVLTAILYFVEAYSCSTRRYLANALPGPAEVESYVEGLRQSPPIATWTVRCFHYERKKTLAWLGFLLDLWLGTTNGGRQGDNEGDDSNATANGDASSPAISNAASFLTKKVVTHRATKQYAFVSWGDNTEIALWKRAWSPDLTAPFTKLSLSKVLLLSDSKTRADYFTQQSNFVMMEGQKDQYAEFSTKIQVEGFKPKVLALRPGHGVPSSKLFRLHLFWFFTCLGLTVPYRIWFSRHCDELRVTIVKETFAAAKKAKKSRWFSRGSTGLAMDAHSGGDFRRRMQQVAVYKEDAEKRDQTVESVTEMQQAISESVDKRESDAAGVENGIQGVSETTATDEDTVSIVAASPQTKDNKARVADGIETIDKRTEIGPLQHNDAKEKKEV